MNNGTLVRKGISRVQNLKVGTFPDFCAEDCRGAGTSEVATRVVICESGCCAGCPGGLGGALRRGGAATHPIAQLRVSLPNAAVAIATDTAWPGGGGPGRTSFPARRCSCLPPLLGARPSARLPGSPPARPRPLAHSPGSAPARYPLERVGSREAHARCGARRRSGVAAVAVAAVAASLPASVGRRS